MTLETKAAYARRHGVSKPAVGKWEDRGWLVLHEGQVDVEASDALLAKYRSPSDPRAARGAKVAASKPEPTSKPARGKPAAPAVPKRKPDESAQDAAARLAPSMPLTIEEARLLKERYLGLLHQLEYDEKAALVVKVDDVAALVGQALATVRTKLLAIPAEQAPRLVRLKTPAEMQDALQGLIVDALSELTEDVGRR
jgi:hypothetical protein